ncbi:ribonuclease E inhibitor RraB [Pseudogemmobacter sonorensis]|uniref:ribonuclease E inhibitor RraB n=1 Tax=Pseudogemmobacter sonorensis TaxID=2989681 RepID=UPI00368FF8A1
MNHDYARQRRETIDTFRQSKGVKLPPRAVVDYAFFIEENDADWAALERALRAKGFRTRRLKDGETLIASIGPVAISADEIWRWEELATQIALAHDFYPDGWELDL